MTLCHPRTALLLLGLAALFSVVAHRIYGTLEFGDVLAAAAGALLLGGVLVGRRL